MKTGLPLSSTTLPDIRSWANENILLHKKYSSMPRV